MMARVFIRLSLLSVALLSLAHCGCTADQLNQWKQTHTPAGMAEQGAKFGGAAITAAATGNPLPLLMQTGSFVGWLFGAGSAAYGVHQRSKLKAATSWDHHTERRNRNPTPPAATGSPVPPAAAPRPPFQLNGAAA